MMFETFVKSGPVAAPDLPLVHIMDSCDFMSLLSLSHPQLMPRMCKVFNENILYFFYGKAAYRVNYGTELLGSANAPIVIVTKNTPKHSVKRIYPFDSGAFQSGRFSSKINRSIKLDDYQLAPDILSAQHVVGTFFGSNKRYLKGKYDESLRFGPREFILNGYYNLISQESSEYDDRCSSVEVQLKDNIPLDSNNLAALILPEDYEGDADIEKIERLSGAKVHFYPLYFQTKTTEYSILLRDRLNIVLKDMGYAI